MKPASHLLRRRIAIIGIIAILIGGAWLSVVGSVLIHDGSGQATAVELTNHRQVTRLLHLLGGNFVGLPTLEGAIRVRCRDGKNHEFGYVTPRIHVWQSLHADCA